MSPGFFGSGVCVGICVLSRCESLLSMSTSKRSGRPSPFTSATSTPMAELLICRCAVQSASRKSPRPSLNQSWSGVLEVVRDVEIGRAVAIQVGELARLRSNDSGSSVERLAVRVHETRPT